MAALGCRVDRGIALTQHCHAALVYASATVRRRASGTAIMLLASHLSSLRRLRSRLVLLLGERLPPMLAAIVYKRD